MVYTIVVHLVSKDDPECIAKLSAKLVEASQVYSKDKETLSWFVMQDTKDKRKFCIVERYLKESVSQILIFFHVPNLFFSSRFCHTQFSHFFDANIYHLPHSTTMPLFACLTL